MLDSPVTHKPDVQGVTTLNDQNRRSRSAGSSFEPILRPHDGYRTYLEGTSIGPSDIPRLFSGGDLTAQFPSVNYAAGWAHAEYAISPTTNNEERMTHIRMAEERWQEAIRMTDVTYELLPGRFLLWPCTKWRYQFAVDTIPTLQAMAEAKEHDSTNYNQDLLEQSRYNVNATVQKLMGKYAWALNHYTVEHAGEFSRDQINGRLGSIIGVAIEGATLSAAQFSGGNDYAVLPPSLKADYAGTSAVDLVAHTTRNMTFSAQVKKRVQSHDRKKYKRTALICAEHHMTQPGEQLRDVIEDIAYDTNPDRVRRVGEILLKVMKGSQRYGCSPMNPRPAHTTSHKSRAASRVA